MRVALITDGIWPYVLGGMQKHSYYLCKYLAQQKINVDLYHFNQSSYDISNLEFFSDDERLYITSHIVSFPKSVPFPGHYIYNSYRHSKLIHQEIKNDIHKYDFIYAKGFTGWHLIKQKHKQHLNYPPVGVKFHGYEMFQKPPDFKTWLQHVFLLRRPARQLSKCADVVFSYGGKITEIIRSIGVEESRVFELPSGVESTMVAEGIHKTGQTIKFLFLGRYERRKGIEELNITIGSLMNSDRNEKMEFHFVGPIPEKKKLKHSNIIYYGEVRDRSKLLELIKACDVLICPSWSEGMPNAILEAMSLGLAVIATDVGATNVLVKENTGWLIKNSEPSGIKQTILAVLKTDRTKIDEKKQNALTMIKDHFTWEKLIQRFVNDFLKKLVTKRN